MSKGRFRFGLEKLPANILCPARVGRFRLPRMHDPEEDLRERGPSYVANLDLQAHRAPVRMRVKKSPLSDRPQSNHMNLGGPASSRFSDRLGTAFLKLFHRDGISLSCCPRHNSFNLDPNDLFHLEPLEDSVENAALRPAIQSSVDGMPSSPKRSGQSPPLATVLRDVQDCIEHLKIAEFDVASLHRYAIRDELVLGPGDLHCSDSINFGQ